MRTPRSFRNALCAVSLLVLFAPGVRANSVFLNILPDTLIVPGVSFDVTIHMDFTLDPTLGGGFDVLFDPAELAFDRYEAADLGDPSFQRDPDVSDGALIGFGFGDFGGLAGPALVGTLSFLPLPGFSPTQLLVQPNVAPVGPFVSATTFAQQDVAFGGTAISNPPPIPLPGAAWLLAGALLTLRGAKARGETR